MKNTQQISHVQAKEIFGLSKMQFNSLISAIPKEWKFLKPSGKSVYEILLSKKCLSKYAYNMMLPCSNLKPKVTKWSEKLEAPIEEEDFVNQLRGLYSTTNIPKYRSFQYRLLHRALVLNTHLFRWNMRDTNLCSQCENAPETLEHFFFKCPRAQDFWNSVKQFISEMCNYSISISIKNILWSTVHTDKRHLSNLITLLAKQFMYKQRCLNKQISLACFKKEVYKIKNMEKYIAIKNNNTRLYSRKWGQDQENVSQSVDEVILEYITDM